MRMERYEYVAGEGSWRCSQPVKNMTNTTMCVQTNPDNLGWFVLVAQLKRLLLDCYLGKEVLFLVHTNVFRTESISNHINTKRMHRMD